MVTVAPSSVPSGDRSDHVDLVVNDDVAAYAQQDLVVTAYDSAGRVVPVAASAVLFTTADTSVAVMQGHTVIGKATGETPIHVAVAGSPAWSNLTACVRDAAFTYDLLDASNQPADKTPPDTLIQGGTYHYHTASPQFPAGQNPLCEHWVSTTPAVTKIAAPGSIYAVPTGVVNPGGFFVMGPSAVVRGALANYPPL